jgi:hypothetical protein
MMELISCHQSILALLLMKPASIATFHEAVVLTSVMKDTVCSMCVLCDKFATNVSSGCQQSYLSNK